MNFNLFKRHHHKWSVLSEQRLPGFWEEAKKAGAFEVEIRRPWREKHVTIVTCECGKIKQFKT